jgi:hypothetical protein
VTTQGISLTKDNYLRRIPGPAIEIITFSSLDNLGKNKTQKQWLVLGGRNMNGFIFQFPLIRK